MKFRYNLSLLEHIIERDKCIINTTDYLKLNRDSVIKFVCQCGSAHQKEFRWINERGGAFCKSCTKTNKEAKKKEYNLRTKGVEHPMHSDEVKQKIKLTNLEKYGTEHPMQSKEVQERTKKTILERYGVEYLSQNSDFKDKIKQLNLKKIGVENQFQSTKIKDQIKQTNLKKYGTENPSQSEEIKRKKIVTSFKNYGVEHPMQNSDIAEKQFKKAVKLKNFNFPDGTIIKVQGYETIVLQKLVDEGYESDDIITSRSDVPEVWYRDLDGKKHRYYCDIYILSENKIIEVKSAWTYEKDLHTNILKAETCKELGYNFEFWIFDRKMKCEIKKYYEKLVLYGDSIPGYEKVSVIRGDPNRSGLYYALCSKDVEVSKFAESLQEKWQEYRGFKIGDVTVNNKEYKDLIDSNYYTRTHKGFQKIKKVIRHRTNKKLYRIKAIDSDGNIHQVVVTEGHSLILQNKQKVAAESVVVGSMLYDYR